MMPEQNSNPLRNLFLSDAQERWVYALLLVFTASVYGSMAMMSIGSAIAFAGWILFVLVPAKRAGKLKMELRALSENALFYPTILLSLTCVWSLYWAELSDFEFYGLHPQIDWIFDTRKLWHIFFPFVLVSMMKRLNTLLFLRMIRFWLMMALAMCFFGLIQYHLPIYKPQLLPHLTYDTYIPPSGIWAFIKGKYHVNGLAGFHLSFAAIIGFPTAVWIAYTIFKVRLDGWSKRAKLLTAGSFLFVLINFLTYSKITWLVIPAFLLGTIFSTMKGRIRYVLTALMILLLFIATRTAEFKYRFQGTDTFKDRIEIWSANIEMIKARPFFGVGWHHNSDLSAGYYWSKGITGFISHAHNNILDQWSSTGTVGLIFFVWWNAVIIFQAFRIYRKNPRPFLRSIGFGLLGGWFCLHASGLTQTNFWDSKVLHQIAWVTALTLELTRRMNQNDNLNLPSV